MDRLDRVGVLVVVGFVVLLGWAAVGADDTASTGEDPVGSLVTAWERSRTATYHATGTFERRGQDGARLSVPVEVVQRPPDRLVRRLGETTGRRGDRELSCPAPVGGDTGGCSLGPPGSSWDEAVADDVRAFASLVRGSDPLYEVTGGDDGCWRMRRTRDDPRGGFGIDATLCVDQATGALRSVEIDHGHVQETTSYDDIGVEVTDQDLEP